MVDLLENFSIAEIILCLIGIAVAIKGVWDLIDYFRGKYKLKFNKDYGEIKEKELLEDHIHSSETQYQGLLDNYNIIDSKLDKLADTIIKENSIINDKLNLLSDASKNSAKSWLVKIYYESLEKHCIDDFTKDLIERRYEDYKKLGGNSYITQLVEKMREMPTPEEYKAIEDLKEE